jgi:hypothetical protein
MLPMTKAVLLLAVTAAAAAVVAGRASAQAQPQSKPQQPPQTVRCIKDSFGNYTCTDGTRVVHDSFDNAIVIPPRREERAR